MVCKRARWCRISVPKAISLLKIMMEEPMGAMGGGASARTVHLALIGQDDLAAAARRVDRQGFLERLLNVFRPYAFYRRHLSTKILAADHKLIPVPSITISAHLLLTWQCVH